MTGDLTVVNTAEDKLLVQEGVVRAFAVRVRGPGLSIPQSPVALVTRFFGVASFDALTADYMAGYRMSVRVSADTDPLYGHASALSVTVLTRTGPEPVHFYQPIWSTNTWAGVPVVQYERSTVVVQPWTTFRSDSELTSLDDIRNALGSGNRVCVAGDGFTVGTLTTHATTLGAWRYTGDDGWAACSNR